MSDRCSESPKDLVISGREELGLNVEGAIGVDCLAGTVLLVELLVKLIHALGKTTIATVGSNLVTVVVSAHHIDGWADNIVVLHGALVASAVVCGNEVEACEAATVVPGHVNVVLDRTSSDVGVVCVFSTISLSVLEEDIVVLSNSERFVSDSSFRESLRADILDLVCAINVNGKGLEFRGGVRCGLGLRLRVRSAIIGVLVRASLLHGDVRESGVGVGAALIVERAVVDLPVR